MFTIKPLTISLGLSLLLCLWTGVALADASLTVVAVTSGDTLTLSDNSTLRLAGIMVPGAATPEIAKAAQDNLQALAGGKVIPLQNPAPDRYGRITAEAYISGADGKPVWLQGELVQAGLAFVYLPSTDDPRLNELRQLESTARQRKQGLWANAAYADLTPEEARAQQGGYAFVSGVVVDAVKVKDKVYLDFGSDWHHDFTALVMTRDLKRFHKSGIDVLALKGKTIRLRGWISRDFRPLLTVSDPAQIDLLP